jgi:hypothetical protein
MKKFLLALAGIPTPQFPAGVAAYIDRYHDKGAHRDAPGTQSGWFLATWMRQRNDAWFEVFNYQGIRAAIALNYDQFDYQRA